MYGKKNVCSGCGCKFYDFGKKEVTCPKCKTLCKESKKKTTKAKTTKAYKNVISEEELNSVDRNVTPENVEKTEGDPWEAA